MATAARRLQWLLLLLSFSAVLRPTWTGRLYQIDHEGTRTGFRQPDGAGGASSVRGLHFPVWCLLVHFGSIEKRASRSAIRRMRLAGVHQPARHLLHSHGMSTTQMPIEILLPTFCQQTITSELRVFLGVGLYFLLLLLACKDVERHPGPNSKAEDNFVHKWSQNEKFTVDDLVPLINEMRLDVKNFKLLDMVHSLWMKDMEKHVKELKNHVEDLNKRIACLERGERRKNVVLFGVPNDADVKKTVDDVILKKLSPKKSPHQQEEIIERAYRFGRDAPQRPILIRFKSESDKVRAMNLAPSLKGTKITISDDLTAAERLTRRKIVCAHKEARAENLESKVLRQGLLVEGEIVPQEKLNNSDWLQKFLPKKDIDVPPATANESSPPVKPTPKVCPSAPIKTKR